MEDLYKKLSEIQQKLKAPKSQYNEFSKFYYRNCEDILEAVKPLLGNLVITLNDETWITGDWHYIKTTVTITDGKSSISTTAYAREALVKKGMDEAQITGAASSYARKYALNGLLLIDDTKDADNVATNQPKRQPEPVKAWPASEKQLTYLATLVNNKGVNEEELKSFYKIKSYKELSASRASSIIAILVARPDKPKAISTDEAAKQPKPIAKVPGNVKQAMGVGGIITNPNLTATEKAKKLQEKLHLKTGADLAKETKPLTVKK